MHLESLEVFGFKSFAERTKLTFLPPAEGSRGITSVVGPNGSGKSNVADAIRWVLGEQSLRLLRGKKAEDVIFSGSEKRGRSGFAEVTLRLNNEDGKLPVDWAEVAISRRVYRDGESEYLINNAKVRLADIQLLLAQAQVGSRSYAVVGQGMADAILSASPEERKEFFDEAAGVKHHQIKRQQAANKLTASKENLLQAELLLNEIEPRLRSLSRQVERLSTRATIEEELHAAKHTYYGRQWQAIAAELAVRQSAVTAATAEWEKHEAQATEARAGLANLRREEVADDGWQKLQREYQVLVEERSGLERQQYQLQSKLEVAKEVRKQAAPAPLPLSKIIEEVGSIAKGQAGALAALEAAADLADAKATLPRFAEAHAATSSLAAKLERPAAETVTVLQQEADPTVVQDIKALGERIDAANNRLAAIQRELATRSTKEQQAKDAFFALQRQLEERLSAGHAAERRQGDARVDLARVETRRDTLLAEMVAELGENAERAKSVPVPQDAEPTEAAFARIHKLKYQLELIGGIDPEVVREHAEIKERHDFLSTQVTDLRAAIADLETVIAELDRTIAAISAAAFKTLNEHFGRFFKHLFGGGKAELVQVRAAETEDGVTSAAPQDVRGIDIIACPPGKKISNVTMLSGGERAMTSVALLSAIMVTNPSPFVVLDEVDAALDEANAERYASIVAELAEHTQFIVITHNRATMRRANVLYGVTMREDGTSQLLSVHLEELEKMREKAASGA